MKCLKVEDYVRRTASQDETRILCRELEGLVENGLGAPGRTMCDRVMRACNEQLGGAAPLGTEHLDLLMALAEVALRGFDGCPPPSDPLYIEKILVHVLKKVAGHGSHAWSQRLGDLLYERLASAAATADRLLLAQNCFAVLWTGPQPPCPDRWISEQLKTLRFLLLQPSDSRTPSKLGMSAEDALARYARARGGLRGEDGRLLLEQVRLRLLGPCGRGAARWSWPSLCEVSLCLCRHLGEAGLWDLAEGHLERDAGWAGGSPCLALARDLARRAAQIHHGPAERRRAALRECARDLRAMPAAETGDQERHAVLQACQLITEVLKGGRFAPLDVQTLLAWYSFLEGYQDLLEKHIQASAGQPKEQKHLHTLSYILQRSLADAQDSLEASQLEEAETLESVLCYCRSAVGRLVCTLRKLAVDGFDKAVTAITGVARGLHNRKLYDQGFSLVEELCLELQKDSHGLPPEKLNRTFILPVLCSRRAGRLERALDWVAHWLRALGDHVLDHMTEPVTLWAKIKADAMRAGQEDIRLRTLRDGLGQDRPGEEVMTRLLEEELRAHRALGGDTAQERYNVLCDLLEVWPEGGAQPLRRAAYLCDMAQVVCFQDFSEQTDCSAVDFTQEALRLLEEEPETAENSDRLKDQKAQAFLWFYVCTLEKRLHEAKEWEQRMTAAQEQSGNMDTLGTNDLDYEDKQKRQDSRQVYQSLHFNLTAQSKQCQPLDSALELWRALLAGGSSPAVRSSKQTGFSIALMAALYKLMGKPLQALESYQLAARLARGAGDARECASSLCQSARLLLELGAPELARVQLEQVEELLQQPVGPGAEGPTPLDVQAVLLKAQLCHSTGQVELGVSLLNQVLEKVGTHPKSKAWYLLLAQAQQTVGAYLSLDATALPPRLRQTIAGHGLKTAYIALDESLRWLCSLVVNLVGNGLYGHGSASADTRFVDQGDNVLLKWQVLSEVLSCSLAVVAVRSRIGTIPEAKARCLEALKLATKLQTLSQCAELMVAKAELELQMAELELSGLDLEEVAGLLDVCTDFVGAEKKAELRIKTQKGRLPKKASLAPEPPKKEEDSGGGSAFLLRTRAFPRHPLEAPHEPCPSAASPPLKARPERWLASLGHDPSCACPCCSEPRLGRVVVRWAAAKAELTRRRRREGAEGRSRRLFLAALSRAGAATARLGVGLGRLMEPVGGGGAGGARRPPSFLHDLTAKIYLRMALAGVEANGAVGSPWEPLESGLAFVGLRSAPELALARAGLLAAQALASILALASKQGCRPHDLFSPRWAWNPPVLPKHKPKPVPSTNKSKEPNEPATKKTGAAETKKARELAAGITPVPRLKITFPYGKLKATALAPKSACTPRNMVTAFDFDDNEVPQIGACTPVPKVRPPPPPAAGGKPGAKLQVRVLDESSPALDRRRRVPGAPKRNTRSRLKVEFSEESDAETEAPAAPVPTRPRSRAAPKARAHAPAPPPSADPAPKPSAPAPKRPGRTKRSTALPVDSASSADDCAPVRPAPRRGRTRKAAAAACDAEPERMRSIWEEERGPETSVEELRASDSEEQGAQAGLPDLPDKDFEVLRRDSPMHRPIQGLWEIRGGVPASPLPPHGTHPNTGPGDLSLDGVQRLLLDAVRSLQHLPPPALYPQLCALLALCLGPSDPVTAAMLHAQSLGLTARHHMICHLFTRLWKLRKTEAPDLSAMMGALMLGDPATRSPLLQRFARLEGLFSFPAVEPEAFPHQMGGDFTQQLQDIPSGVTVCLLSVVSEQFGEVGDTLLLSRLERGSPPITMRIPTAQRETPVSAVLQEMEAVQKQQKSLSSVSDKAQWWDGRRALDQRVERMLEEMRDMLGCWQGLLLPLTSDPRLSAHADTLHKTLRECGAQITVETLKAVLSACPLLSQRDLRFLAYGLCPGRAEDALTALQGAVSALKDRTEPQGHVVLVLDKYLQKLPWENIACLKSRSVTRMPSLHFLLGHCTLRELDPASVLSGGVDPRQVYYVLNPDGNLKDTEDRFREWFARESNWQGVCGNPPSLNRLQEAITTKDLYIYLGHGAGARFLDRRSLLSQELRVAALLFGCSSAALAVNGELEGAGVVINYLMAGCPLVVGNLWDVTDRDIDRFTTTLLQRWLSAGPGAPLLDHMAPSRQATYLKHLIGAAPVVYGLPVCLK